MNQNMVKFGQVRENVEKMAKGFRDEVVPLADVSFENLNSIKIGGRAFNLKPLAGQSMATRLQVPYRYLERCDADLQALNLNYWVEKQKADSSDLYVRYDGDAVRAVFTKRFVPLDNLDIVNEMSKLGLPDDADVQSYMDDRFMMLNVPSPDKKFALTKKDEMIPGFGVSNSEVGLASFSVSSFLLRLVCTNGLISRHGLSQSSFRHVSAKVMEKLPTVLEEAASNVDFFQTSLQEAKEVKLENPDEKLIELNDHYALGEHLREAVEWAWPQEKGGSMFHIVQTMTRAVQYDPLKTEDRYRLQVVGGQILSKMKIAN